MIRNTGGRVTSGVFRDLAIIDAFAANWPGDRQLDLLVIHHTECGMARLLEPDIQSHLSAKLGTGLNEVASLAISEPTVSVRADIERLRNSTLTSDKITVTGYVYDVKQGKIAKVE